MKEILLTIENDKDQKVLRILEQKLENIHSLFDNVEYPPTVDLAIIVVNGKFAPPFEKGSEILRNLRASSFTPFNNWDRVFLVAETHPSIVSLLGALPDNFESMHRNQWGIWFCQSENPGSAPDILALNYPVWHIKTLVRSLPEDERKPFLEGKLSQILRLVFIGIECIKTFKERRYQTVLFSDMGADILNPRTKSGGASRQDLDSQRVRVFVDVLGTWLRNSPNVKTAIVAFGDGLHSDVVAKACADGNAPTIDESEALTELHSHRKRSAELCAEVKSMLEGKGQIYNSLKGKLTESSQTFNAREGPLVFADLTQGRALAEAVAYTLITVIGKKSADKNLSDYLESLRTSGKFATWVISYLDILRTLGNDVIHYKEKGIRKPSSPVLRDVFVAHSALQSLLDFLKDDYPWPHNPPQVLSESGTPIPH